MAAPASVDVVVVSYCCKELLRRCLESLRECGPSRPRNVFVVDNGSRDGSVEMVRRGFPDVALIEADANLGFARANNLAIERGRGDFVLLLNPDTRLTEGAVDRLLGIMESRAEIGICGPRLELEDGTVDHACARSFPTILGTLGHFTGLARRRQAPDQVAQYRSVPPEPGPVDLVSGACMLVRRDAFDDVGLFDEGYWMYIEDMDLCYRFAQTGWVTWYEPTVTVVHAKRGSGGGRRSFRVDYAFHYGMYRFYRKHYAPHRPALVNAAVYAGMALKLALSLPRSALVPSPR